MEEQTSKRIIAICGTAGSSRRDILDQPKSVELWGLNTSYSWMPRIDRLFEIHREASWGDPNFGGPEHLQKLQEMSCPVFMVEKYAHIFNSVRYPIEAVLEGKFKPFFSSTIAYMLALAIHERVPVIRLLGVDMKVDSEYHYQREALLYWQGIAEGLGLDVQIPDVSPLTDTGILYGREPIQDTRRAIRDMKDRVNHQIAEMTGKFLEKMEKDLTELRRNLDACSGAVQACDGLQGDNSKKGEHESLSYNPGKGEIKENPPQEPSTMWPPAVDRLDT